jgi:hypothetical protein
MTIIRVQGNARGVSATNSITVTLGGAPTSGNILICTVTTTGESYRSIDSLTQTNVVWNKQLTADDGCGGVNVRNEIWYGIVSASAGTELIIALSGTPNYGATANVCEYSGMLTADYLDKTATNSGSSSSPDTGITLETTQATELWIGLTVAANAGFTQSTPTNGFTLLDGAANNYANQAYLEKIVSSTATANSGTTASGAGSWAGIIATFIATAAPPAIPSKGSNIAAIMAIINSKVIG